jgi:hypothetical protein
MCRFTSLMQIQFIGTDTDKPFGTHAEIWIRGPSSPKLYIRLVAAKFTEPDIDDHWLARRNPDL